MNAQINTEDLDHIKAELADKDWLVACLCAAWCDTCNLYRSLFDALAGKHPEKCFAWIDIEDQAHLVDAIDIENFPTILIQYKDHVVFLGTVLPDGMQLQRLITSMTETTPDSDIKRSTLNQDAPPGWNIRDLILNT
ncbi:thioredoxin family protein [Undibacterium sp. TJN19]|uniref:thioredoxin family protein n=1 Tax=Undibacterium sp. TJN19 TaxID=3413055 RepID=UPI003BF0592B